MLTLKNISAGYGGTHVIHNINANINGNVAIVGPNGCGKSTLLKTIANILPYQGTIALMGQPTHKMKNIAKSIAMLSQQPTIYFDYSVYDTVMMGRYIHIKSHRSDMPNQADKDAVLKSLAAVNLLPEKNKSIATLSGGQLQRVFLARALAQAPQIILLDEPTNHLDLKCQIEIISYLKQWSQAGGRAVVGVLHDINLAMALSDDIILMKDGKIVADAKVDEVIASNVLDQVYEMDVAGYMRNTLGRWQKNSYSEN